MPDELSQEDIDALLAGASVDSDTAAGADADLGALLGSAEPAPLPDFGQDTPADPAEVGDLESLNDVNLDVKIELGRTYMAIEDILRLKEGAVVQLDKDAGAPVDILINGRLIGFGEVLVLNDYFCVRVTEILSDRERAILNR